MVNSTNIMLLLQELCLSLALITVLASTSCLTLTTASVTNRTRIQISLIHPNSVSSPFYRPQNSDDVRAPLSPDALKMTFLVNVSIGVPPVPQFLIMDTGSTVIWACAACSFDPNRSSTYKPISCGSKIDCQDYNDKSECRGSQCTYKTSYSDGSYSNGVFATDTLMFGTSSEGLIQLPNTLFGLGLDNKWSTPALKTGIFGVEPFGKHSLLQQVGNKFSYCLGNISDPSYMYNQLILGEGAKIEGPSTPLGNLGPHLVADLVAISVGGKKLDIAQKEFGTYYSTLIDSGTTSILLRPGLYTALRDEIKKLLEGFLQPVTHPNYEVCYSGNLVRDLKGFPVVTLHFAEDTDLDLNTEAMFRRIDDNVFCLLLHKSDQDLDVIGIYAQQYYNVAFDLDAMSVSFQNIDCSLLED